MVSAPIRHLLAPNPSHMTLQGTNTYLIGTTELAVVDPGPDLPEHIEAILRAAGATPIRWILVTHRHSDHLPAALPLSRQTGAPLYGHAALPGVQRPLADDEVLEVDGLSLRALYTPGHTSDHHCYLLEQESILFSGDLIVGQGTVVVGSGEGELAQYLASLRRLLAIGPARILPGHGPAIDDPAAKIQEYLDHRQAREDQIVRALAGGPCTIAQLRQVVYPELAEVLTSAAENNLRTHLLKLRSEGRAALDGELWRGLS
jgi:glyoxylase-like metal-dependent hydrolase (beta-lactamase superfamily II)